MRYTREIRFFNSILFGLDFEVIDSIRSEAFILRLTIPIRHSVLNGFLQFDQRFLVLRIQRYYTENVNNDVVNMLFYHYKCLKYIVRI